ncbi:MAG: HEAT repeat domain-containing protein, partial [Deltaproteobacteria bacterium]|nr:HEAT repeat domain-containing protein [Deltaproteobacteria bacterium]
AQARQQFVNRLSVMGDDGARALAKLIADPKAPEAVRQQAVTDLLRSRSAATLQLAVGLLGKGSRTTRRAVALAIGKRFRVDLLMGLPERPEGPGAEADLWRAIGIAAGAQGPAEQATTAAALAERLTQVKDYERRYRLLQALGALPAGDSGIRTWWQGATANDARTVALRRVTVRAARRNPKAQWLRQQALGDPDPGVRMLAAETTGKDELATSDLALIKLLGSDPWPDVRIGAAAGLAQACATSARTDALVGAAKSDSDVGVQQRAMKGLIDCAPGAATPTLFAVAGDGKQDPAARVFAITQLGVFGKSTEVPGVLKVLDQSRRKAFDSEAEQQVAAAAITALGRLGDSRAVNALLSSSQDEAYPQIQAAAAAALARFCTPVVTKRLQAMTTSAQRTVSLAAKRSLASCRRR